MLVFKNSYCEHCGESDVCSFALDEFCLRCCIECEVELSRSALPYYEFLENEELALSKMNTVRTNRINLILGDYNDRETRRHWAVVAY